MSADDLDELGSMLEVAVQDCSERCGTEADVVQLVKGTTAQLQQRLKELHAALAQGEVGRQEGPRLMLHLVHMRLHLVSMKNPL